MDTNTQSAIKPFYEEKEFDGVMFYRTTPGGGFFRKREAKAPRSSKGRAKMSKQRIMPASTPIDKLINRAQEILGVVTKSQAIIRVGSNPSTICRIRAGELEPSAEFVLKFHDATGMSIEEIRSVGNISKLL